MVAPVLLVVVIGIIYVIMQILKRWGKMSKHETLNAVGTVLMCYGVFTAIVLTFPISWFEKYVLCGVMGLGFFLFGIAYFYKKQDIRIDQTKLNYCFNFKIELIIMSMLLGFGTASLVSFLTGANDSTTSVAGEYFLGTSLFCYVVVIVLAVSVWRKVERKLQQR